MGKMFVIILCLKQFFWPQQYLVAHKLWDGIAPECPSGYRPGWRSTCSCVM